MRAQIQTLNHRDIQTLNQTSNSRVRTQLIVLHLFFESFENFKIQRLLATKRQERVKESNCFRGETIPKATKND